jgi:ethanolamine utilization microcompartment shell protein EutS
MKKLALVLVLVLAFALPVLANPFVDVPLNHWAYDSVQSLAAKGVIVGYPDGTFGGAKSLTRYEFAEAVAKALAFVETQGYAVAGDVAILEKLAIEFADELASLGVTVADLEAASITNAEAIAALDTTVAKLDSFWEPVVISGDFTASYEKVVVPMAVATLTDETNINIVATINDVTTAGISVEAVGLFAGTPVATWNSFFIDYQGADLQLRVGEVAPADIGLGLVYDFDELEEFDGFLATWIWDTDNDLGNWTLFGDVEDYYVANISFAVGDEDEVVVGVTGSYDVLASGYAGSLDLAFVLGEDDETAIAVEAGVFYDTALTYAGALTIGTAVDDLTLDIDAHYVIPGFVPSTGGFTADTLGVGVSAGYPLTDKLGVTLGWTYEMDSAMVAATTHDIDADLLYTVDADTSETAGLGVSYDVLLATAAIDANYMNYPLTDDYVLSGAGEYDYPAGTYAAVATLEYALATDIALTVEGRVDSDGVVFWSAEAKLVYTLDTNTALTVGYEQNDWADDIDDYGDMDILDALGTLSAELAVTF